MDSDHEDYVFCGTPIESEEQVTTRKKKAVAEASGNLRSLPAWKQEVTDEEGRRRFHGAFTGGFAAGYYNTVGSKEGWIPQTFTSSRKNRAEVKQQSILNFLDEDEKSELEGQSLKTSMQFDTFGFTSAEIARKQAEKEQHERPSAIPGPVPDELILPTTESIGVKLLLKMGWRHGHSIKDSRASSLYDARREARKAFLAFSTDDANITSDAEPVKGDLESLVEQPTNDDVHSSQSTPVYVLHPKNDLHGLGFDPFKHAPEFRERKRSRVSGNKESGYRKSVTMKESLFGFKPGKVAPGFGIGALEELDTEDEDVYSTSFEFEDTHVEEEEKQPSELIVDNKKRLNGKERGVLLGFKIASKSDYQLERFDPPVIPKDFIPQHKFSGPLETDNKVADPPPTEVPPPEDSNLKVLMEGVATLVAKCGKLFEDLSREKNQSNPLFCFLVGGNGSDYYTRKLWEEQQKHNSDKTKLQLVGKLSPNVQQMTAQCRGKILGERPLERDSKDSSLPTSSDLVQLQVNLKDTFTKPSSFDELPKVAKPFTADPAKQERFERFLKEKYEGGLRSYSGGTSNMSESARARERLDFEAAAEAIEKGKWTRDNKLSVSQFMEFAAAGGTKFTFGGLEQVKDVQAEALMMKKLYPKREEFQWHPAPVLCKRFDLTDPYMGKPPPAPRIKSKMDSLIFMPDYVKATKAEETETMNRNTISAPQPDPLETMEDNEKEGEVESVERPVDLYKAIFSDDSDDEGDIPILNKVENPEKKAEAANTTLNRLIAGDFLESLGKELGLEVPPEMPCPMNKAMTVTRTENASVNVGNAESETTHRAGEPHHQEIAHSTSKEEMVRGFSKNVSGKANKEKVVAQEPKKADNLGSTSSSEDERSRKHSRRGRYKSSDSSSEDQHRSRDRKKESHREKSRSSSSRKHSNRHKHHKRRDYPSRSHRDKDKDRREAKREKRKWRD